VPIASREAVPRMKSGNLGSQVGGTDRQCMATPVALLQAKSRLAASLTAGTEAEEGIVGGRPEQKAGRSLTTKRPPTLFAIIVYKLLKGCLFLSLAVVVYCLSDNDLPKEYQSMLSLLHANPDNRFFARMAVQVGALTETKLLWTALATFIFSLFSLVEGVGLILGATWAGWLAIGESGCFVPIEVFELMRHWSVSLVAIMVVNIVIIWYLYVNRHRLLGHHGGQANR